MILMNSFSLAELSYAQKYPFAEVAKRVVKESGFTLENIPEPVLDVSRKMINAAFSEKEFVPKIHAYKEIFQTQVLAFPVSKILVSIIGRYELYRKFSKMFSKTIFTYLESEKDDVLIDLAYELKLGFDLADSKNYFVKLDLSDYLKPELNEVFMKLINSDVEKGKVFLNRNDFARFISLVVGQQIIDSLPVPVKNIPSFFKKVAENIEDDFSKTVRKRFSKSDFGEVAPESFPPCMQKMYSELASGIQVNHSARFAIATFLSGIGMSSERIIEVFRSTPNFNERTTRYQVEKLAGVKGKGYASPSCDKLRTLNLCVSNCPVGHPIQFYSKEILKQNIKKEKQKKEQEKKEQEQK